MRIDAETLERARPDIWDVYLEICAERNIKPFDRAFFFQHCALKVYEGPPDEIEARIQRVIKALEISNA